MVALVVRAAALGLVGTRHKGFEHSLLEMPPLLPGTRPRANPRTPLRGWRRSVPWERLRNYIDEWEFILPNTALLEVILASDLPP